MTNHDKPPVCILDRNLMNANTIGNMDNIGLSIFAPLCGKNRGVFVLNPPDGKTYGCSKFPATFAALAGVDSDAITDSNSIPIGVGAGSLSGADAVDLIDLYVRSVYTSSAAVEDDPYGCDCGGLAVLECGANNSDNNKKSLLGSTTPVRAATLAGMFVPAPWATGGYGTPPLTLEQARSFYTLDDFEDMVALGLNTVQIPVPVDVFAANADGLVRDAVSDLLELVKAAGLHTILVAVDDNDDDGNNITVDQQAADTAAAAAFAHERNVLALTLPASTPAIVRIARAAAPGLPLLLPTKGSELQNLNKSEYDGDDDIFAAVQMEHSTSVADVASSSSIEDRGKMTYHESMACIARSPIEYSACYRDVPVFVSNGFDLSIDDCIHQDEDRFQDFGQCGRFNETIDSGWWKRHRTSFAERQFSTFERGAGWSFAAWKLFGREENDVVGAIDSPAKLLSLRDVAAAGLLPSLTGTTTSTTTNHNLSCLNGPINDAAIGDETHPPSPAPPPDCGNGWWNSTTGQCDYWIPPEDRVVPPAAVAGGGTLAGVGVASTSSGSSSAPHTQVGVSAMAGGAIAALVCMVVYRRFRGTSDQAYTMLR